MLGAVVPNHRPHLAEQLTGSRDFLDGTLDDVLAGRLAVPPDRPVIFSPFGLGVLDLAVGKFVYDQVARSGELHVIEGPAAYGIMATVAAIDALLLYRFFAARDRRSQP